MSSCSECTCASHQHGLSDPIILRSGQRELFLDDFLIAEMDGIRRRLIPAEKHPRSPLITPDAPYETEATVYGGVVREAPERWRMWYLSGSVQANSGPLLYKCLSMAYAESRDGLAWIKPNVNASRSNGEPPNAVLGPSVYPHFNESPGPLYDPADPERPYKLVFVSLRRGAKGCVTVKDRRYRTAFSRDGLRWTVGPEIPTELPTHPDICHLTYDPVERRYVLWARAKSAPDVVRRRAPEDWFGRGVSLLTSRDFVTWQDHGVVLTADAEDPPGADIYSLAAFRVGALWAGLVQFYDQTPGAQSLEIQLACSRDGVRWTRLADRAPILPVGGPGEWDRFNQSVSSRPIEVGDETWLYYGGRTYRHPLGNREEEDSGPRWSGIGLATWRRDGFVALEASFQGGTLLTPLLRLESPSLILNVKSDFGAVIVEALNAQGDCVAAAHPLRENSVRARLAWTGSGGKRLTPDRPVRLRIRLENARLFSIACGDEDASSQEVPAMGPSQAVTP